MEELTIVDTHGIAVFTRWWPVASPDGVVLISHGASEHSGRYDRFARALNEAGFAAAALDHRGHGHTAASSGTGVMGPGGGDALVDDIDELRARAASTYGAGVPLFLFGHSMGSLIALGYLTRRSDGLAGGLLCGFPAQLDDTASVAALLRDAAQAHGRDEPVASLSMYNAPFEPARTPYDWLSRDPDEVDRYIADPMCGDDNPLTHGFVLDLFDIVARAADELRSIHCPVLVIAGDQDAAGGMGAYPTALSGALRATGTAVDLTLYEGARHELLNETDRDDITADIVAWLRARLTAPPRRGGRG